MDLTNLKTTEEGVKLQLRHPATDELLFADDKEKRPMQIELAGSDSKRFRKINAQLVRRMQGKKKQSTEDVENGVTEQLVGVTLSWSNIMMDGKELLFDVDTAKDLYNGQRWIREQVAEFISDRSNFLTNASLI